MDLTLSDLTEPQILVGTVQLTLQEEHVDRFKNSKSLNKGVDPARFGDIRQWLGKGGKVSVATAGTKSIKLRGDKLNEYVLLPLICTFAPDAGTNFTEAQLDFVLETPQDVPAAAIADEMFPLEIEQECRVEKHLKIEPNFSFSKVKVKLGSIGDKKKYILYEPHITALHLLTSKPAWSFRSSSSKSLNGMKNLFLRVKKPAGVYVKTSINVSGRIQTSLGPIPIAWAGEESIVQMSLTI